MPHINNSTQLRNDKFSGVTIYTLSARPKAGVPQEVLVEVAPNQSIPLHTHSVDARMIIVAGAGTVLSHDASNGQPVKVGDVVFFEADAPHGFAASETGLAFLSQNGGIVDTVTDAWDVKF